MANYSQKWKFSVLTAFFVLNEAASAVWDASRQERRRVIQGYPGILSYFRFKK